MVGFHGCAMFAWFNKMAVLVESTELLPLKHSISVV